METVELNAANGQDGGAIFEGLDEVRDEIWLDHVVAINETDEFASGFLESEVAGGRLAGVLLIEGFDARIFFGVLLDNFW